MRDKKSFITIAIPALFLFVFAVWAMVKPVNTVSESERRNLAARPEFTLEAFAKGTFTEQFEKYTTDQFPLRDGFRSLKAVMNFYVFHREDMNGIYREKGYLAKLEYPLNEDSVKYAADKFRVLYDKQIANAGGQVYLATIPDKGYFLADEGGYPSMDYEKFNLSLREQMPYAQFIDIWEDLSVEDYYKTDIHWRQERLEKTAKHLIREMGGEASAQYLTEQVDVPFFGVYYGQLALPVPPDEIWYLTNDMLNQCTVTDYETGKTLGIYDWEKAKGRDPYEMYLSGSKSLLKIENLLVQNGRKLIVFRDSFGSSLVPLLAEAYEEIVLVDIRYLPAERVGQLVEFEGRDVLFLYSTSVLNNSITLK